MSELLFDGMSLTVEIGFSSTPPGFGQKYNDLSLIIWTDVTEWTRNVQTSRGRSTELDDYMAGSCSVALDNRDRRFDPDYTSGPYYGNLTPLRPIRIRVTPAGSTVRNIFFGYIEGWPQAYSNPNDATVTIRASDGFKILNLIDLQSPWIDGMEGSDLIRWWRLSDPAGSFYIFDSANNASTSAQWMSAITAGVGSVGVSGSPLVVTDSAASASFDGQRFIQAVDPLGIDNVTPMASEWVVSFWFQTTETETGNYGIWNHGDFIHGGSIGMVVAGGNATIVGQFGNRGASSSITTKNVQVRVNDGKPHYVVMHYKSVAGFANEYDIWVDGVSTTVDGSFTDIVTQGYSFMTFGAPIYKSATASNNFTLYFKGQIQDIGVINGSGVSNDGVIQDYQRGAGTYLAGSTTDFMIYALALISQWPSDGRELATGESTVLGMNTAGKTALSAMKECEQAEQGRLFMSVDGKIKFVDRNGLGSGSYVTVQEQFDDLPASNPSHGIAYTDITLIHDDRFIFNDVTASQTGGISHRAQDATSQQKYYPRASTLTNLTVDTGYLVTNIAESRLSQYKEPAMRIDSLSVNGRAEPSNQDALTSLDIGDRVTVIRTPLAGTAIEKTLIIEGIKQQFTPNSWTIQFNTSPTNNSPFVLDSSLLGVLDTNILGF